MATYWVSPSGNDSDPGSLAQPWLTLQHAAATIAAGDIVRALSGTYTFTDALGSVFISTSGTDDNTRTVFLSDTLYGAKIINNITPINNDINDPAFFIGADFVDVTGFDISGAGGRVGVMAYGHDLSGSGSPVGSHMRVRNCYVHDLGTTVNQAYNVAGIQFNQFRTTPGYNAMYNEASGNIVQSVGQIGNTSSHGIYFGTGHGTAQNNIVSGVPGFGIRAFHFVHHMTIANNLIFNCGSNAPGGGDGLIAGGGIYLSAGGTGWIQGTDEPCDFCVVNNNIIRDCIGYGGIYEYGGSQVGAAIAQVIANNTFSNNCFTNNYGSVANPVKFDSGTTSQNQVPQVVGSASGADTFTRANQSGLGTASDGEVWSNTGDTANVQLSIVSNQGKVTNSANDNFLLLGGNHLSDCDLKVRIKISALDSSAWFGVLGRYAGTGSWYAAILRGTHFSIQRDLAGSHSIIADLTDGTITANTEYWIRFSITGTTLSAKYWLDGSGEPGTWNLTVTDTNFASGQFGLFASPGTTSEFALFDSFTYSGTTSTDPDPLFVSYQLDGTGDYHLQAGSPCIDAGTSSGAPASDLDGAIRPRGAGFDIGPYEYSSAFSYSDYKNTIEPNLVAALAAKNLLNRVQLIGPDTQMANDSWLTSASSDLASTLSGYVRHAFPASASDISNGSLEVAAKSLVGSIYANDNTSKPVIQAEMGYGYMGPGQSVALYQYGVEMADFAVQLARAGMAALIAYDLDDDMHGTEWGMWQITTDTGTPRPWFFPWSLLTQTLVPGSTLYAPAQPTSNDLRVLAARSPQGGWTFVLVNRRATTQNVRVAVPFAPVVSTALQVYAYSSTAVLFVDSNGFPLASGTLNTILPRGFTLSLAGSAVLILTEAAATETSVFDVKRPPLQKRR